MRLNGILNLYLELCFGCGDYIMKSDRNKTIDLPLSEGKEYLDQCLTITCEQTIESVQDKILLGDTFSVLPLLPKNSVDLLIADPPYNL